MFVTGNISFHQSTGLIYDDASGLCSLNQIWKSNQAFTGRKLNKNKSGKLECVKL